MLTHQTHRIVRQSAVVLSVLISQVVAQDAIRFADVQLTQDGVLQGAVSTTGRPLASAVVEVRYQGKTIAVASSSANGQFAVSKVRPGVHEIVVGSHAQPVQRLGPSAVSARLPDQCGAGLRIADGADLSLATGGRHPNEPAHVSAAQRRLYRRKLPPHPALWGGRLCAADRV